MKYFKCSYIHQSDKYFILYIFSPYKCGIFKELLTLAIPVQYSNLVTSERVSEVGLYIIIIIIIIIVIIFLPTDN